MAIACADRLGTERGVEWTGGASIVGVDGWVAAERADAGMSVADVNLRDALEKRLTDHADAFADRRPDIYAALASSRLAPDTPPGRPPARLRRA
jgi:5-aminopentanamidase